MLHGKGGIDDSVGALLSFSGACGPVGFVVCCGGFLGGNLFDLE